MRVARREDLQTARGRELPPRDRNRRRFVGAWAAFALGLALPYDPVASAQLTQSVIPGPVGSGPGQFGETVVFLPNGNYVVSDPRFDLPAAVDAGAVHLHRASDNAVIATLTGSAASDLVGSVFIGPGIVVLPSGDYLVLSRYWHGSTGAVTWCDGETGCSGVVDATNSLVGTAPGDLVGYGGVTVLASGNYLIPSRWWNGAAGAVTWCNGTTGCTGVVSAANSAVGTSPNDNAGDSVRLLGNGNYLITANSWDNPAGPVSDVGAVRLCQGATGCFGAITPANSYVGTVEREGVRGAGVALLSNGNYVVYSPLWGTPATTGLGAATFCSGLTGCVGAASAANSLVGTALQDRVGVLVVALRDGNYVVQSPIWDKGEIIDAGALTWCSGVTGCPPGPVTEASSLTGASVNDWIGIDFVNTALVGDPVVPMPGGAYVVRSQFFDLPGISSAGAVTWCGTGGAGCTGATVTPANSLVGSRSNDLQQGNPILALDSGAFVVALPHWESDPLLATDVGAVVFCDSITHCQGQTIGATNSLVGTLGGDGVGSSVRALANGNYVVASPFWNWTGDPIGRPHPIGAATLCNGTTGCQGPVTLANSFVSRNVFDGDLSVFPLVNGNYVVASPLWRSGSLAGVGAVQLCSGTTGCVGTYGPATSLVGTRAQDSVGSGVFPLPDGRYVVASPSVDDGTIVDVGAISVCSATSGCTGPVTTTNSLLGTVTNDRVGWGGVSAFSGHLFTVLSRYFSNGPIAEAAAVTIGGPASASLVGRVDPTNSVIGSVQNGAYTVPSSIAYDETRARLALGMPFANRVVLVEVPEPGVPLTLLIGSSALVRVMRHRKCRQPPTPEQNRTIS